MPFSFNSCVAKLLFMVEAWKSNYTLLKIVVVINYPFPNMNQSLLIQGSPDWSSEVQIDYITNIPKTIKSFYVEYQGGRFKNTYELLNLRALKISKLHKNHIFQCMGKIFCVEFQRVPLKFHTKYLTHTLKDVDFIHIWKFKSS